MNNKKVILILILIVGIIIVSILLTQSRSGENGGLQNIFTGNIFSGTTTTKTPSGSTVTKEPPSTVASTSYLDRGPGRSTVFPDNDRGTMSMYYDDSKTIKAQDKTWFPGDVGSYMNSPYGNPFNHLFPVDSTGKPTDPSDVISHATTSAYGTLPPVDYYRDYKYTDRPGMPQPNTRRPSVTTSAYGTLPGHTDQSWMYTDRPYTAVI